MRDELEMIKEILNSKLGNNIYSPEELDEIAKTFAIIISIKNDYKNLKMLGTKELELLINKNIINYEEKTYLETYKTYTCIFNKKLENKSIVILNTIIDKAISALQKINEKIENKEIKELLRIVDNNFIGITEEQLDLLFDSIKNSDRTLEEKRDAFIYVSVNSITNANKELEFEEIIDDEEEIKGIRLDDAIVLFEKYGYNFELLSDYNKDYILQSGSYIIIDDIFEVLKDYNINLVNDFNINIFDSYQNNICDILVKSNSNCVKGILDNCIENDLTKDGKIPFYILVEDQAKFIREKKEYRRRFPKGGGGPSSNSEPGKYESYFSNVEFFKGMCERIYGTDVNFLKRIYEKCNGTLLTYPHHKVLEVERILKTYGFSEKDFFEAATSVFLTMHHADVVDIAVELRLLDYFKKNQSRLSLSLVGELPDLLFVASLDPENSFRTETRKNFIGEPKPAISLKQKALKERRRFIAFPKGIKGVAFDEKVFETFKLFDDTLANSDFDINQALRMSNSDDINTIKVLEEKFKKNDLEYEINGIIVSRIKVLRIYSALSDLLQSLDPKKTEYLVLLYALSKNSYFNAKQIISFSHAYKDAKEEMERGMKK